MAKSRILEPHRLQLSDMCCLDKCKCGGNGRTLQMSTFMTTCVDCKTQVTGDSLSDVTIKWNLLQRNISTMKLKGKNV